MVRGRELRHGWLHLLRLVHSILSPRCSRCSCFIAKNPSQMLDDILAIAGNNAEAEMAKGESELKIRFRQDLADTLCGEVAFALDGPILPHPHEVVL